MRFEQRRSSNPIRRCASGTRLRGPNDSRRIVAAPGAARPPSPEANFAPLDRLLQAAYHATMRPASFFAPVASILKAVAHRHGIETPLFEHRLRRRWSEIVGDQLAAHTRPDLIRFKKLYLIVENSVWLQQLTFLKPALLEKINEAAGSQLVSDIIFRVGEISSEPQEAHRHDDEDPRPADPSPESLAQAAAHAAAVKDPDLRARLIVVMAQALSLRRPPSK